MKSRKMWEKAQSALRLEMPMSQSQTINFLFVIYLCIASTDATEISKTNHSRVNLLYNNMIIQ